MRAAQSASGRPPQGGGEQNPGRECGERKPEAGGAGEKPQGGEPRTGEGGATRVTSPGKDGGGSPKGRARGAELCGEPGFCSGGRGTGELERRGGDPRWPEEL